MYKIIFLLFLFPILLFAQQETHIKISNGWLQEQVYRSYNGQHLRTQKRQSHGFELTHQIKSAIELQAIVRASALSVIDSDSLIIHEEESGFKANGLQFSVKWKTENWGIKLGFEKDLVSLKDTLTSNRFASDFHDAAILDASHSFQNVKNVVSNLGFKAQLHLPVQKYRHNQLGKWYKGHRFVLYAQQMLSLNQKWKIGYKADCNFYTQPRWKTNNIFQSAENLYNDSVGSGFDVMPIVSFQPTDKLDLQFTGTLQGDDYDRGMFYSSSKKEFVYYERMKVIFRPVGEFSIRFRL